MAIRAKHAKPADWRDQLEQARARADRFEREALRLEREVKVLAEERIQLRTAIKLHHAAQGHDRCWQNDEALYGAAGLEPRRPLLPARQEFLLCCDQYWHDQTGTPGVPASPATQQRPALHPRVERIADELFLTVRTIQKFQVATDEPVLRVCTVAVLGLAAELSGVATDLRCRERIGTPANGALPCGT